MTMDHFDTVLTLIVFAGVILGIAFDLVDMVLAALVGVSALIVLGVFNVQDILTITRTAGGPIALLFGGMIVARTLRPTGIFEYVGTRFLLATRGSGKRFLLGLVVLVAPLCAVLPNATTVILLAPVIIGVAVALKVDFVAPMVLTAIISNSAGLLTLVGDPATFLVGSSIGMTFNQYLKTVSLGGLLALLSLVPLLPLVLRDVWRTKIVLPEDLKPKRLDHPAMCVLSLIVLAVIVFLFIFGESLPRKIVPPAVSILGATLALLVTYGTRIEPVSKVLEDVDWRTLVFLICLFCLVEAVNKTGILQGLSNNLYAWFGTDLLLIALILLGMVGAASSVLANIPVVAAMLLMVKGYLVTAGLVPELALSPTFVEWPATVIPVFVAMMFAGTLGGNATLIGASANVVCVGICAARGKRVSFGTFMRYGLPLTIVQLAVSALYVLCSFLLLKA
ncbi:MAG TPA: SLC13 family permease [Thermodesulfobacteriota bacterium]|nr:SLC13 family permease [Thermodesulfobacteriota bacterium]